MKFVSKLRLLRTRISSKQTGGHDPHITSFTRVKASQVKLDSFRQCSYPQSPALVFSIISAATILMAQIIINVATGCFCCIRRTAEPHLTKAFCFYIILWITFIIGTGLLLAGAALNDRHDEVIVKNGGYYCYVIKPGVFATGVVLAAVSSIFGVFYYQTLKEKGTSNVEIPNQGGIVRAQPQFQIQNSGFVNEDAYKL
ncbi:hypothetical protein ES288_A08G266000v1 [Gossypium darwinii]|uniref:Uncharacterized protein n=1 Tax=Gossypium darwinii TaxID=34276 RepID=A0A5D2FQN9_GOSDA|nr:hypothetical protein ES288_A08G266000v1 [Gossypium darwinii]